MDIRNVGGTPGGTRTFLLGIVMVIIGGYLLFNQVQVHGGGYWRWGGFGNYGTNFGITLIPLLIGITERTTRPIPPTRQISMIKVLSSDVCWK